MIPPANTVMQSPASVPRASVTSRSRRLTRRGGALRTLGGRGVRCIHTGGGVAVARNRALDVPYVIGAGIAPGIGVGRIIGAGVAPGVGVAATGGFTATP